MLVVNQLKKSFGSEFVLNGIQLEIQQGQTLGVLGASGSGKSTFLRCLNQLEIPTEGNITLSHGRHLRSQIGMVFQGFNLFSNMTVLENLIYAPVRVKKEQRGNAIEKAYHYLQRVKLEHKAMSFPHTLSGGEKQRAAIARTLMMDPQVILFDEPTSALDPRMVGEVTQVMRDLANSGITLIIVSHEMSFVREIADRIIYLEKGKIIHDSATEDFFIQNYSKVSGLRH